MDDYSDFPPNLHNALGMLELMIHLGGDDEEEVRAFNTIVRAIKPMASLATEKPWATSFAGIDIVRNR